MASRQASTLSTGANRTCSRVHCDRRTEAGSGIAIPSSRRRASIRARCRPSPSAMRRKVAARSRSGSRAASASYIARASTSPRHAERSRATVPCAPALAAVSLMLDPSFTIVVLPQGRRLSLHGRTHQLLDQGFDVEPEDRVPCLHGADASMRGAQQRFDRDRHARRKPPTAAGHPGDGGPTRAHVAVPGPPAPSQRPRSPGGQL